MNKGVGIFLVILSFALSIILCIFESASYVYYDAQNVYRVYLNGSSIGIIEEKSDLEQYINEKQENLKEKYNVNEVYMPTGLQIKNETTYNEQTEDVSSIYNKISEEEDFTIDGYVVKITDTSENDNEEPKEDKYIYILDKEILSEAINDVVRSFVDEQEYEDYLNETTQDPTAKGTIIENVYIKDK